MSDWSESLSEFYRQTVECLCGTLDLEQALKDFYALLRQHVPVTRFSLGRALFDVRAMEGVACCQADGVELFPRLISRSVGSISKKDFGLLRDLDLPDGVFIRPGEANSLARFMIENGNPPPFFFLRMRHEDRIIGGAVFQCSPTDMFSEADLEFLRVLRTPLFMALNAYFQYHEMRELKENIWRENLRLHRELQGVPTINVVGAEGGLAQVMETVRLVGPVDVPVLISGETGTGKEVVAEAVHALSHRHNKPFVAVNCGAIPPSLIDAELFGHVRGAFTGATADRKGRFERANGGTIFLDEIGELPAAAQVRLLRVLQDRMVERVGGHTSVSVDFRLLAATNRDLLAMVRGGRFREDLYYRLRVVAIHVPPLRERRQDLPLLVEHLLKQAALRFGINPPFLAPGEMERLAEYSWPGNVRELRNVVEEALVLMPGGPLRFNLNEDAAAKAAPDGATANIMPAMREYMREYCVKLLQSCGGRIGGPGGAAEIAGVNSNTLRSRMDRLGVSYHQA